MQKRANLVSVGAIMSGPRRFRSDPEGRGYVWGAPEIAQLLIDLEVSARDPSPDPKDAPERLYLGVVTAASLRSGGVATVTDGQQRLAAIAMFLAFARDRAAEKSVRRRFDRLLFRRRFARSPEPRIQLKPGDHSWFANHILEPGSTLRLPAEAPPGGPHRLLASARFMQQAFAGYSPRDVRRYVDFLLDHAAVVLAEAGDGSAALLGLVSHRQRPQSDPSELVLTQLAPQPAPPTGLKFKG